MAAKKAKVKKAAAGTRKRLTPEIREAIARESPDLTLAVLAEKYDTSINTIAKYRNAGSAGAKAAEPTKRGRPAGAQTTAATKGPKSNCPPAIFGILSDSALKDSQKVKMIAAYYEV